MKKLLLILVCILSSMNLAQAQCDLNFDYVNTGSNMTAFFTPPAASAIHDELGDGDVDSIDAEAAQDEHPLHWRELLVVPLGHRRVLRLSLKNNSGSQKNNSG